LVPLVLLIPVENLPQVKTIPCRRCQQHRWHLATGINNTSGKFATGVNKSIQNPDNPAAKESACPFFCRENILLMAGGWGG
jgi:hypothetical protein